MLSMRSLRAAAVVASLCLAGAGCTTLLGDFSQGSGGDGGTEGGSGTEGGGADGTTGDSGGSDSGDATTGKDGSPGDGPGGDGGDSSPPESGTGDASDGGGIVSCSIAAGYERMVNAAGATIAADKMFVYNASQTNVLAIAQTSSPPSLAYWFRSDRPSDAAQLVQMAGAGGPARYLGSARSVAGTATYVYAQDGSNNLLFYDWVDSTGIGGNPSTSAAQTSSIDFVSLAPTTSGVFYEFGGSNQTYVDWEVPPTPFSFATAGAPISPTDQNGSDGTHAYRLSDDTVSVLFTASDGTTHQSHYGPGSTTLLATRPYYAGNMLPFVFAPDGQSADLGAVEFTSDASYGLFTGVVPESQLFTFDLATSLFELPLSVGINASACAAPYPGKLLALLPQTAGLDLYVIDMATGTIDYSLTGASNVLHTDTAIIGCAVVPEPGSDSATQLKFDIVWTDNAGGGPQNVMFAPLVCTLQ
jgi:hypothetical protein